MSGLLDRSAEGEAAGNPLALVELPVAYGRLGEGMLLPIWLPLTTRLEQAFARRISGLPTTTRTLLLVAALDDEDGDVVAEVLDAAGRIVDADVAVEDLAPAIDARLVDVDDLGLRFRHPLVRSALHQAASISQRHAVHAALADALVARPERSVWHRAAASVRADEDVAAGLEVAAATAQRRGAPTMAVAALERAAQLSGDRAGKGRRLLRGAEVAFELGRHDVVVRLLEEAEPLELGAAERRRLLWLRELFEERLWPDAGHVDTSVALGDQMRLDGDPGGALDLLLTAGLRCWWSNPDRETRDLVVAAAERLDVSELDPKLLAVLSFAAPDQRGATVIDRIARITPDASADPEAMRLLGTAATAVGAFEQSEAFLAAAVDGLRAQGRRGLLARALVSQAWAAIHLGSWRLAGAAAAEADRLARESEQPRWAVGGQLADATLAGLRGDEATAEVMAADAERLLLPSRASPMLALVQVARGAAALGAGHHADAYDHLQRIFAPGDIAYHPFVRTWVVVDLVEAAAHSGRLDEARAVVAELEHVALPAGSPVLRAGLSYARPLLAEDEDAEELFRAGLENGVARWPLVRARLLLAHGTWLRRRRRIAESRAPLRAAREALDALGASPWAQRASQELRASGQTVRQQGPDGRDELTPQELQIARLAAAGLTNREIGERLYLSHRTVGSHLYRTFPKLGITSQAELGGALSSEPAIRA